LGGGYAPKIFKDNVMFPVLGGDPNELLSKFSYAKGQVAVAACQKKMSLRFWVSQIGLWAGAVGIAGAAQKFKIPVIVVRLWGFIRIYRDL